jgi:hypothetical protein
VASPFAHHLRKSLRDARFQVAWESCAGVCPELPTCGESCEPSGGVWGRLRSVATQLLHAEPEIVGLCCSLPEAGGLAKERPD